jgi:hypothetical protein
MDVLNSPKAMLSEPLSPQSPSSALQFPDEFFSPMKQSLPLPLETNNDAPLGSNSPYTSKTVRFSPLASVTDILSRHDMSLEEHHNYWLQAHEYRTKKQLKQGRIQAIEEFHDDEHDGHTALLEDENETKYNEDIRIPSLESGLQKGNPRSRSCRFETLEEDLFEQADRYYAGI